MEHKCIECEKTFSSCSNLYRHVRTSHNVTRGNLSSYKLITCILCDTGCLSKKGLEEHLLHVHNIQIEKESRDFEDYEEFLKWKGDIEKENTCSYVKRRGSHKSNGTEKTYFYCHRSGIFQSKSRGERTVKMMGTNKMNGTCPSMIKVCTNGMKTQIEFTKTHVGHNAEIGRLRLTKEERERIASKLSNKIPIDDILDEIRDSLTDKLERIHLLTRKDVLNVKMRDNIHTGGVLHASDYVSVEKWIENMKKTDDSLIILYKSQNLRDDKKYPGLNEDDFLLVIMNKAQREMLRMYGNDVVCFDFTHGMNAYNFDLGTVLVLDDKREGFPAAFILSNRQDGIALKVAFDAIKQHVNILPKIFMSDDAEAFSNAWSATFGEPEKKLLCTWHVDRNWRKKLSQVVNTFEDQAAVYKIIRCLLTETDEYTFEIMLQETLDSFDEVDNMKEFGQYFKTTYANRCKTWAYCYRKWSGVNTNMHLERMHRTIKYLYLDGKKVKRLDKSIFSLMRFSRDRVFDRLIALEKGKISSKITNLRKRHKAIEKMSGVLVFEVGENMWNVSSTSKQGEFYNVKREDQCSSDCTLVCKDCGFCLHNFTCDCTDNSIQFNMCKHIHLVCSRYMSEVNDEVLENDKNKLEEVEAIQMPYDDSNDCLYIDENLKIEEREAHLQHLIQPSTNKIRYQEDYKKKTQELLNITAQVSTDDEHQKIMKIYSDAIRAAHAVLKNKNVESFECKSSEPPNKKKKLNEPPNKKTKSNEPPNKKIQPQRFISTKKKPKKKDKKSLSKPTSEECQKISTEFVFKAKERNNIVHKSVHSV